MNERAERAAAAIAVVFAVGATASVLMGGASHERLRRLYHKVRDRMDGTAARAAQADLPPADAGKPVTIRIDVAANRHPISPLVYGVNYAGDNARALNCPLDRMGGNNTSRYNWRANADNKANDYYYESIGDKDPTPGKRVSDFIRSDKAAHSETMITIPTVGWVAKLGPDRGKTWSFSVAKYGKQQSTDQWAGDAGNGKKPDGAMLTGNDPRDASLATTPAFFQPWVKNLTTTFGATSTGRGVDYYLLDNEPGLWHNTHRDVWPIGIKRDDLFARSRDTAAMIKATDPTARVVGPEEWGWTGYQYSDYDSQWGDAHHWSGALADRDAHGGVWMAPWLLQQFAKENQRTGKRLLDVFSLHYYPQGGEFNNGTDIPMQLRRNRSTRSLWDPTYKDETWINDTVQLVPRMKKWVADNYPGTQTGLTEYSWGADDHINGATTQADILGILGRENIDLATRWVCPDPKTPTFKAFQLFRNYDGKDGTFGDTSVACAAPDPDAVSAFAAQDGKTGALTIMLVAKTPGVSSTPVTLSLAHFAAGKAARAYQLTAKNQIAPLAADAITTTNNTLKITLPAQSATLIVVPKHSS